MPVPELAIWLSIGLANLLAIHLLHSPPFSSSSL
jgi:hypothetical protein